MLIAKQVDFLYQSDGSFAKKFWQDSRQKRLLVWSFLDVKHESPRLSKKISARKNGWKNNRKLRGEEIEQ